MELFKVNFPSYFNLGGGGGNSDTYLRYIQIYRYVIVVECKPLDEKCFFHIVMNNSKVTIPYKFWFENFPNSVCYPSKNWWNLK